MADHPHVPHDDLPRSPTGRVPQWVVEEARTGRRTAPDPWRVGPPLLGPDLGGPATGRTRAKPHRRRRSHRPVAGTRRRSPAPLPGDRVIRRSTHPVAWTLLVALVLVTAVAPVRSWAYTGVARLTGHAVHLPGTPTPGREEADTPLGTPAAVSSRSSSFAFMHRQPDGVTPVTWDPCRPIHYVTRPAGTPAGGDALVAHAIAAVTRATGLRFVDDGATTESVTADRAVFQPDRYGDRWAPVLIAWETPDEQPRLAGSVAGLSGPAGVTLPGADAAYVSGTVELDGQQIATAERVEPAAARLIVMHELGHLVGLDHVDDPTQAMNPIATHGLQGFAAGDLTGLARLGRGDCRPDL
ncbi:matrixin family metalloprotease [Cellulomonas alba]|uniref:Matrixin family metalloprotease n=1 Tax=Cellulomonas alba TaxID=3053467 RepID=A0ABT7SF70_9CELL|nr:matrixin family metalloprotease [Cellulomonas alba]MDM7854841.1 matrixin family metalloprotease [Cellulomonas alba]